MGPADLLPKSVLSSPASARTRVAAVAAAACAACALSGCWVRFGDGIAIRLTLGITSAIFGALTVTVASNAKSAWGAAGRALGVSTVLGAASIVGPSFIVAGEQNMPVMACIIFGSFFGAITGFIYGLVLAPLAALVWRDVNAWTHEGADRATRAAAGWAVLPMAMALASAFLVDARAPLPAAVPFDVAGFAIVLGTAAIAFAFAELRIVRRRRWIARVVGEDPRWTVRAPGPHDDLASLPRLRDGGHVLEYLGEEASYRVAANARPVALL